MGKSMKLGGGGRFAKGKAALEAKGHSAESAGAIMAAAGRKKYGAGKMASMAAKGKARAAHNTRIDMGSAGEYMTRDEQPYAPEPEMHSMAKSPHPQMAEQFKPPDSRETAFHAEQAQHHAAEAAKYGGKSEEMRSLREHHEGMARAHRAHLSPKYHNGPGEPI